MGKNLVNKVGERGQDNLIAGLFPRALTTGIKVAAGEGLLPRGAVLARKEDGTYELYGKTANIILDDGDEETSSGGDAAAEETASASPSVILVDPVDASDEAVAAAAYYCGCFNPNEITVGEGYTLTAEDKDTLRKYNIVFRHMMED